MSELASDREAERASSNVITLPRASSAGFVAAGAFL